MSDEMLIDSNRIHKAHTPVDFNFNTIKTSVRDKTTLIMIDSHHLHHISTSLPLWVDYVKLNMLFRSNFSVLRSIFYANTLNTYNNPAVPVIDFTAYNGYETSVEYFEIDKQTKQLPITADLKPRMLVDMFKYVYESDVKHVILFTGSSHFVYAMKNLKHRGVIFTIVSSTKASDKGEPKISALLRQEADFFIDLSAIRNQIEKTEKH